MSLNQTVDKLVFTTFHLPNITARHLIGSNTLQETDLKEKKNVTFQNRHCRSEIPFSFQPQEYRIV